MTVGRCTCSQELVPASSSDGRNKVSCHFSCPITPRKEARGAALVPNALIPKPRPLESCFSVLWGLTGPHTGHQEQPHCCDFLLKGSIRNGSGKRPFLPTPVTLPSWHFSWALPFPKACPHTLPFSGAMQSPAVSSSLTPLDYSWSWPQPADTDWPERFPEELTCALTWLLSSTSARLRHLLPKIPWT